MPGNPPAQPPGNPPPRYALRRQRNGSMALYHGGFGETMHPGLGPWREANRLYVEGGGLENLLRNGNKGPLVLFDVGLGGAANAVAAITCHQRLQHGGRQPRPLRIISFEAEPAMPAFALEQADRLDYLRGFEDALGTLLREGVAELPGSIRWELRLGDFTALIAEEPERAELIFYDPFSPTSNPAMWRVETLEALYRCRRPDGATRLITYSAAISARAAMMLAGFYVGEGPQLEGGHDTTEAAGWPRLLSQPLPPAWLGKALRSKALFGPDVPPTRQSAMREALREHAQWGEVDDAALAPPPRKKVRRGYKPRRRGGA